jgi:hypothetical protein
MRNGARPAAAAFLGLLLLPGTGLAEARFGRAAVYLERNVTDQDAEIRFEVTGGEDGLVALRVVAPDGRTVLDFKAPESRLGMRHFNLESPEPRDDGRLQAEFPAGPYRFLGNTLDGTALQGTATLSHALPPAASIISPRAGQAGVPVAGLRIEWRPVPGLVACIVTIEQERTGREIRADLAGTATAFVVPDGFLVPETKYKLSIGTVSREGNRSFVETQFMTAGRR